MSEAEVHPATLKFQLAVPRVAQAISPTLAAIHVTRTRLLHPRNDVSHTFDTTHCRKCGTYWLEGTSPVRVTRRRGKRANTAAKRNHGYHPRVLRRSCAACGEQQDLPIEAWRSQGFPRIGKKKKPLAGTSDSAVIEELGSLLVQKVQRETPAAVELSRPPSAIPSSSKPSSSPPPAQAQGLPLSKTKTKATLAGPLPQPNDARNKARTKKKTGLQDMLARNKAQQAKEQAQSSSSGLNGGLAAFLQNL